MNTESETSSPAQEPDYKIAARELDALFASLNLPVQISPPFGICEEDWPRISWQVQIGHQVFPWRAGIGHVNWKEALRRSEGSIGLHVPGVDDVTGHNRSEGIIRAAAKGQTLKKEYLVTQAKVAAFLADKQKVRPNPAEVLACVCRDAISADQSFEDWASEFGYDADSRKAEAIYHECKRLGSLARSVVKDRAVFVQLADLSSRL